MALSNSERQARYRQRLKTATRGHDLPERIAAAIDAALDAVWRTKSCRDDPFHQFPSSQAYKSWLVDPTNVSQFGPGGIPGHIEETLTAHVSEAPAGDREAIVYATQILRTLRLNGGTPVIVDHNLAIRQAPGEQPSKDVPMTSLGIEETGHRDERPRSVKPRGLRALLEAEGLLD